MAMREATLDRFVHWKNVYDKAEYAGMEEVDGKPCHKIVMTPKAEEEEEQDPETIYIDKETNLISKITAKIEMAGSSVPVALIVSDYKDVDGIKLSHKMKVVVAGQEQVMTIDNVKNNVDIPGDQFDLPKEVKELIKDE